MVPTLNHVLQLTAFVALAAAQTLPPVPALTYDAASIHKSAAESDKWSIAPGPQGGLRVTNAAVLEMVATAYHVQNYQIVGARGRASSERFALVLRSERREFPIYNLVPAKGGSKLTSPKSPGGNSNVRRRGTQIIGTNTSFDMLAGQLATVLERPGEN